jgi:hypothetical protein
LALLTCQRLEGYNKEGVNQDSAANGHAGMNFCNGKDIAWNAPCALPDGHGVSLPQAS